MEREVTLMNITDVVDPTAFISAASQMQSAQGVMSDVGLAVFGKSLDTMNTMGDAMTRMMEQSVAPHIGGNFDAFA